MLPPHNTNSSFVLGNVKGFFLFSPFKKPLPTNKIESEKKRFSLMAKISCLGPERSKIVESKK